MAAVYGEFDLDGHHFQVLWPENSSEPTEWTIIVTRDAVEVRRETLRMTYAPRFGADVGDVNALNARVEEIIQELGLQEDADG